MAIRQSGGRVGRTVRPPDGKPVSRPSCLQSKGHFPISVSFSVLVAACGSKWQGVASFSARFQWLKRPTFAPKRQGKAKARTAGPGSVLLLGSKKVSGDRCLAVSVTTGLSPIRSPRIFVSSKTQQGMFRVTRNIPCGLLPQALPLKGEGASSPKSGSLSPPAVCV